jgi:hypothetical protein
MSDAVLPQQAKQVDLLTFILSHTDKGDCQCPDCLASDTYRRPDPSGGVDLVFFKVGLLGEVSAADFISYARAHAERHALELDPFDGEEHSFIELGGWLGDQQAALRFIGMGAALGLFEVLTPYDFVPGADAALANQLASRGYVTARFLI